MNKNISLKEAVKFHGHLGPYLVLGLKAGELALKKLKCKKYFCIDVKAYGATLRPKSCLVDGLQLSTGATFGKGNIHKFAGKTIRIIARNLENKKEVSLLLNKDLITKLNSLKGHRDSELLAKRLYKNNPLTIFNLKA